MSSESEREDQLQEQIDAVRQELFKQLRYFLTNKEANMPCTAHQRLRRSFALLKLNKDPDKIRVFVSRSVSLERQPSLKLLLENYNGEELVNIPLSSIEAHEIISNLTPADYALLCEHGAREYIKYMEQKIAKLEEELTNPDISPEEEQATMQFRDVFEDDMRKIERYLDGIMHGTDTDWRKKIPLYSEIGGKE